MSAVPVGRLVRRLRRLPEVQSVYCPTVSGGTVQYRYTYSVQHGRVCCSPLQTLADDDLVGSRHLHGTVQSSTDM